MDAYFDNGGNILNCSVRVRRDHSAVYTLSTTKGLKGRKATLLRDENPQASPARGKPECVGFILWREKAVGVFGQRRSVREVRRRWRRWRWRWRWGGVCGWLFGKNEYWRWAPEGKEFNFWYDSESGWKVTAMDHQRSAAARFLVPERPSLFSKESPSLHLTQAGLEDDEVFLILALVYCETKRQDALNMLYD
ncbi:hypothetical protein LshimejAT787_0411560 [Lyophyllum shimeji]|uniref:Uncharacterized protein n=1 Tax=Lyophyllum shimeji TaxID=47721 RepID=A0A9P3PLG6_LYOSH|nr:hypothetical protein LshimejAT787_0411560 [Lyophyllum shimeji]